MGKLRRMFGRRRVRDAPEDTAQLYAQAKTQDYYLRASEGIAAASGLIAGALAASRLRLYKDGQPKVNDPLDKLVSFDPAPGVNGYTFVHMMETTRLTQGRAYAWIHRGRDMVQAVQLEYLDPAKVTELRALETGDVWYQVALDTAETAYIHESDVLALRFISNGVCARPVDILKGTLGYDSSIKEFSLKQLDGVHDTMVITVPSEIGEERKKRMVKSTMDTYNASGRTALVVDGGVQVERISASAVDPHVLDVEKVTKNRIAAVYNIPPHLLGAAVSSKTAAEEEFEEFLALPMLPVMVQWEAELNKKLLSYERVCAGETFQFDRTALRQVNTEAMAEKYHKAVRGGWMTPNDVRKREGLSPDPNGNKLMISRDLLPLEVNVQHPEMLLGAARGKTNDA